MCFLLLLKGATLFGVVRRVMPMQHAEILFVLVAIVVLIAFIVAFILSGRLVRLIVRRRVI